MFPFRNQVSARICWRDVVILSRTGQRRASLVPHDKSCNTQVKCAGFYPYTQSSERHSKLSSTAALRRSPPGVLRAYRSGKGVEAGMMGYITITPETQFHEDMKDNTVRGDQTDPGPAIIDDHTYNDNHVYTCTLSGFAQRVFR